MSRRRCDARRTRANPIRSRMHASSWTRGSIRVTVLVTLILAAAIVIPLRHAGDRLFYRPDQIEYATAGDHGLPVETVTFSAPDGPVLHGWWVDAQGISRGTVVYCHGNHGNLTHHARFVTWLPRRGFNLLIFDYRGFGSSEGTVSRAGTVDDAVAAIDHALSRDPDRTLVFGHSLGGAVGIVAASRRPEVRAVVAESTFPSYRAAARRTVPLPSFVGRWLVSAGHDPIDVLRDLARPLLVVHGARDHITPLDLGQSLFDAAAEPKRLLIYEQAGHETPWITAGAEFEDAVVSFFTDSLSSR